MLTRGSVLPIPYHARQQAARDAAGGIAEAFLVTDSVNVRYLSGFTGSNGWLYLGPEETCFLTDTRYRDQALSQLSGIQVVVSVDGLSTALARTIGESTVAVGFEPEHTTVAALDELRECMPSIKWVPLNGPVNQLRGIKDSIEVDAIRAAIGIAEESLIKIAQSLRPGVSERLVAAQLEYACRVAGAEEMAFDTIIASGARSSQPHGVASERPLCGNELVMIDLGCRVAGYCSDITRMVWLGDRVPLRWRRRHETVVRAQAAALEVVKPGVRASEVDRVARRVVEAAGLGQALVHSVGHGVGLEIHERPRLSVRSEDVLESGMVVTIEPGIYLEGEGGIRVEDVVQVTEDGCDRLTSLPVEFIHASGDR